MKLFDLYIMEKQETCLDKALNLIEKDKYHRSPEPYLYASRVLLNKYQESNDPDLSVGYLKKALKYGSKYVKYKNKTDQPESYDVFYLEDEDNLVAGGLQMAEYYYHESKVSKSTYYVRKVAKIQGDKPSIQVLEGLAYLINRNHKVGYELLQSGLSKLENDKFEFTDKEGELFFHFLKDYKKVAKSINKSEEYFQILEQCSPYFPEEFAEEMKAISIQTEDIEAG